jgi:hypothetical protein
MSLELTVSRKGRASEKKRVHPNIAKNIEMKRATVRQM